MAGRKTKFTESKGKIICDLLREGCTRTDAAATVNVSRSTLYLWMQKNRTFSDALTRAEAECAVSMAKVLHRAAQGWERVTEKVVKRVDWKKKRYTLPAGSLLPDGTRLSESMTIEEEYPVENVTTETVRTNEFDWRAALEWLKRRRPLEWGTSIDIAKMDDAGLQRLIDFLSGEG